AICPLFATTQVLLYLCLFLPPLTTEIYTLSLHDALPIFEQRACGVPQGLARLLSGPAACFALLCPLFNPAEYVANGGSVRSLVTQVKQRADCSLVGFAIALADKTSHLPSVLSVKERSWQRPIPAREHGLPEGTLFAPAFFRWLLPV